MMKYLRLNDIRMKPEGDGMISISSFTLKKSVKFAPIASAIVTFCNVPRNEDEVCRTFGSTSGIIFRKLCEKGFLTDQEKIAGIDQGSDSFFKSYASLNTHRIMLADDVRMSKYREAIFSTVKQGDVVLDAGAGSGVLSVYAALAGAEKVYAIEKSSFVKQIQNVAEDNGVADRIEIIHGDFSKIILPEKVDVIVSEPIGTFVFKEGLFPGFYKCIDNNLKKGGKIIPLGYSLSAGGLNRESDPALYPFRKENNGLDLSSLRNIALRSGLDYVDISENSVDETVFLGRFSILEDIAAKEKNFSFKLQEACLSLALWFDIELTDQISFSTSPFSKTTHWKQAVVPTGPLEENENVDFSVAYAEDGRSLEISIAQKGVLRKVLL